MAKKKLFDEHGNEVKGTKVKKPFYKKVWFWILMVIVLFFLIPTAGEDEAKPKSEPAKTEVTTKQSENNKEEVSREDSTEDEEVVEEEPEEKVSREFQNALKSAQNYVEIMAFSEKGLYKQLTSEAGEGYPADAAQYAIDNVDVDYNEQALKSAINYQDVMPMSDDALFKQLTSEAGEQFTAEQAQYAIDNLPE